ncbi:uncharacterized protein LOC144367639 [Ictidomys tridecemlineatus]
MPVPPTRPGIQEVLNKALMKEQSNKGPSKSPSPPRDRDGAGGARRDSGRAWQPCLPQAARRRVAAALCSSSATRADKDTNGLAWALPAAGYLWLFRVGTRSPAPPSAFPAVPWGPGTRGWPQGRSGCRVQLGSAQGSAQTPPRSLLFLVVWWLLQDRGAVTLAGTVAQEGGAGPGRAAPCWGQERRRLGTQEVRAAEWLRPGLEGPAMWWSGLDMVRLDSGASASPGVKSEGLDSSAPGLAPAGARPSPAGQRGLSNPGDVPPQASRLGAPCLGATTSGVTCAQSAAPSTSSFQCKCQKLPSVPGDKRPQVRVTVAHSPSSRGLELEPGGGLTRPSRRHQAASTALGAATGKQGGLGG